MDHFIASARWAAILVWSRLKSKDSSLKDFKKRKKTLAFKKNHCDIKLYIRFLPLGLYQMGKNGSKKDNEIKSSTTLKFLIFQVLNSLCTKKNS